MTSYQTSSPLNTHTVTNQSPALEPVNFFTQDHALKTLISNYGADASSPLLEHYGQLVSSELSELGFQANQNQPVLLTHDRFGHRLDQVQFHPAYHRLMEIALQHGLHSIPWNQTHKSAQVVRSGLYFLHSQAEQGMLCPVTMTFACIPTLRQQPDIAKLWEPKILADNYDGRFLSAKYKTGLTIGMAMTEKQGGSDVRTNTTNALPIDQAGPGQAYRITGHKWFCSAPMSDAFLMLAYTEQEKLSCFLVPRWQPDETQNPIYIQRLKNKLGNHSNASSEIELKDTYGVMIGEEGRGVPTIIDMVSLTRFDCLLGSTACTRQALSQAIHHAKHRKAFGKQLIEQPLMQNVLADLSLETEAAMQLTFRIAHGLDSAENNPSEKLFIRLATAIGKYWLCKRAIVTINEAQECLGGAGYVEESILPRLYREAPLNSIWEGSGNVQCLDVLRAIQKEPETLTVFFNEIKKSQGENQFFDNAYSNLQKIIADKDNLEVHARIIVEQMALILQASLMIQKTPNDIATSFCASRLNQERGLVFGTLSQKNTPFVSIINRMQLQD